jgi:hypothetical protein
VKPRPPIYGMLAEFDDATALVGAIRRAREEGFTRMDAYTPFPVEEVAHELGFHKTRLPLIVLLGGIAGGLGGYFLQYYATVIDYPLNIGGRPLHSWPSFIPVTFECTVLLASLAAVLGMFALNGLPMPYHPVFNVPGFALASRDRFFLCVEADDPKFDRQATWQFLRSQGAREVSEVPH